MFKNALTQQLYAKFAGASNEWLNSEEGNSLIKKSIDLIRFKYGNDEADFLFNQVSVLKSLSKIGF